MQEQIDEILDHFKFDEVKKTMDALHWLWYDCVGVPEIPDLRQCARRLLNEVGNEVMKNNEMTSEANRATGGFRAQAYRYLDEEKIYFRLSFEVTSYDNYN